MADFILKASLWIYPWDILDEGGIPALHRARNLAAVDAVKVAVTYHAGLFLLPHNPVRRLYVAEDGVVYFRPEPTHFPAGLRPVLSELTQDQDPLRVAEESARATGLGVRAWVVCCHNSRLGLMRPDLTVVNALGDRLPFALCPSQAEVQHYLLALVRALGTYRAVEAIELEALYWLPAEHGWHHPKFGTPLDPQTSFLLGLCCCSACTGRADVDSAILRRVIGSQLLAALAGESPISSLDYRRVAALASEVEMLLETRQAVLTELLQMLAREASVPVHALIGSGIMTNPWARGIDVHGWARAARAVVVNTYTDDPAGIRSDLAMFRLVAPEARLIVGLNATHPVTASAASLAAQSVAALTGQPDELSYYHYGLLSLPRLGWVGQAVNTARAILDEPTLPSGHINDSHDL